VDQELTHTAANMPGRVADAVYVHSPAGSTSLHETTQWQPPWNWRHIRIPSLSIDAYLLEAQSCQISSQSNL